MKRRVILLLILAILALVTLFLVYRYVYNKPHTDYQTEEAEFRLTPDELFQAYIQSPDDAGNIYNGKMIALEGIPDAWEVVDDLSLVVFYMDEGPFGPIGVRCTFMERLPEAWTQPGKTIRFKGFCSGYNGEDVIFEHCSLINE